MENFLLVFIPLFVAIDIFGVLPLFVGLTARMGDRERKRLTLQATATAFAVSAAFLVAGKLLFSFLGITENDFRVGGGVLLLVFAVYDVLFASEKEPHSQEATVGVVPIGIPLIMGPAALTTILFLVQTYGYWWTIASLLANMVIVWFVFSRALTLTRFMGKAGSRAVAKVAALFLAAIAVMMVRSGVTGMLKGGS